MLNYIAISNKSLDLNELLTRFNNPKNGAIDIFIGKVRNNNLGKTVTGIEYDVFEPLALKLMQELCVSVRSEVDPNLELGIMQYKGYLAVNGVSILVVVASAHRKEAFAACQLLIEKIKHTIPIWKKEYYLDGDSSWVKGHSLCNHG